MYIYKYYITIYVLTVVRWNDGVYVGVTNKNKCCGKSGGNLYIGGPLDFKVGGTYPPTRPPCCIAPN